MNQYFESQVYDVFVIRGNSAIFKCQIPSFVTDHVEITEWQDTEGSHYNFTNENTSGRDEYDCAYFPFPESNS